ncbi:MAG: 3-dehydroquinate synthase [Deinococcales bacterium]|jgi:3-dehydroquinate synthase
MGEHPQPHVIDVPVEPAYTVTVGPGVLETVGERVGERRVALVTDTHVGPLHADTVRGRLVAAGAEVAAFQVPAGEDSKSGEQWLALQRGFAREGLDRDAAVVALGGGVVGDLAGFAAATYMRGVAWYQLPTSLLAMVDASVGGKTAIDLPEGKNLVGAFWQPRAVLADVRVLTTLPEAEFRQGAVEHFKHGLLADPVLLERFEEEVATARDEAALAEAIARSVRVKAAIVGRDEREGGIRAHLNLGHTLAHALEAVSGHALPHGDAVAYGLHYAALLGRQRGFADVTRYTARLLRWERPAPLPEATFEALLPFLARDKKSRGGRQRFVLLEAIGTPVVVDDVSREEQERAWATLLEEVAA